MYSDTAESTVLVNTLVSTVVAGVSNTVLQCWHLDSIVVSRRVVLELAEWLTS